MTGLLRHVVMLPLLAHRMPPVIVVVCRAWQGCCGHSREVPQGTPQNDEMQRTEPLLEWRLAADLSVMRTWGPT
jgi:hypothetical protein